MAGHRTGLGGEVGASSTAASTLSSARRRAALSKLQARQTERASAAKAELARQQAETQAELARRQVETQAELARRQAEQTRQQAALEAQELKDEAERCQLELELFEEEENGLVSDTRSHYTNPVLVPSETPGRLRETSRIDCCSERTRD